VLLDAPRVQHFARAAVASAWNFWVRLLFSARARKTAREARALPIPTSELVVKNKLSDSARRRRYTLKSMTSDLDLLGRFARENSQDAFAEIVRRHLNLVYSAALRQVRSPQLAEDIAQSVFADLARNAGKLSRARREECASERLVTPSPAKETGSPPVSSLTPWLYAVTRRTAIDAIRKESRRQLREQIAVELNNMNATANDWTQIEPLLDDAMAALDETDRSAVLLRYFENKTLREVGEALGASEDAAQKRVSRAVERLREFFSKQKITVGAGGLTVLISANAVQSAPVGLAATILSATLGTTQTFGMTMIHKILITGMTAAVVGTGIYSFHLRSQIGSLQQQQALLAQQIEKMSRERDEAANQLAGLQQENVQLHANQAELLKLRGEVTQLRRPPNVQPRTAPQEIINVNPEPIDIYTKARFITIPSEALNALGIAWKSDAQGNKTGVLTKPQFKVIAEAMQGASDVEMLAQPEAVGSNGLQAQMTATQPVSINGTNFEAGAVLDVVPYFSTNSLTFNLKLIAGLTLLIGDPPQLSVQYFATTNQAAPGQTVVLGKELLSGGWLPGSKNIPAGPRSLLIFVTPQVVDSRGNPKYQ
jgi:RNA polymerase sigma factor (sigma-70 family)